MIKVSKILFFLVLVCVGQICFAQTKGFSSFEEVTNNKVQVCNINSVAEIIEKNIFRKEGDRLKGVSKKQLNLSSWGLLVNTKTECYNGEKYFRFDVDGMNVTYFIKIKKQTLPLLAVFVNRTYFEDKYNSISDEYKFYDLDSKEYELPDTTKEKTIYRKFLPITWLGMEFSENAVEKYQFKFRIGNGKPIDVLPTVLENQIDKVFVTDLDVRHYKRKYNEILVKEEAERQQKIKEANKIVDNTLLLGYMSQNLTIPNIDYDSTVVKEVVMEKDSVIAVYYCSDSYDEGFVEGYYKMHRIRIPLTCINFSDNTQLAKITKRGFDGLEDRQNIAWDYTCDHTSDEDSFAGMNTAVAITVSKGSKVQGERRSSGHVRGIVGSYENEYAGASSETVYICTGPYAEKYHSYPSCRGLNRCSGRVVAQKYSKIKRMYSPCRICN